MFLHRGYSERGRFSDYIGNILIHVQEEYCVKPVSKITVKFHLFYLVTISTQKLKSKFVTEKQQKFI